MEGERKGNTALLTVIAIATLLVAVVGATFAYFSANTEDQGANVTVSATTAAARDVFIATGDGDIALSITADKMLQANGSNEYTIPADTDNDSTVTVSLEAGSSVASCTYDLIYTPSTGFVRTVEAASSNPVLREFDISGSCSSTSSCTANNFSNVDAQGSSEVTLKTGAVIEDTYESSSQATVQTWTFTANFYNLAINQNEQIGRSFGGTISVTNVSCRNDATSSQP